MAIVDAREPARNYPVPYAGDGETPSNNLDDDMRRLITALTMIGIDVDAVVNTVAAKANIGHTHALAAIVGLVDALAAKAPVDHSHSLDSLSDVSVAGATAYQALAFIAGAWQPWAVDLAHVSGSGILRVDTPQTLTAAEKTQGLANLGAIGAASPALTGTPTVPTAATDDSSTQIANTAHVHAAIAAATVDGGSFG
jgi:hypothetical protein